MSEPTPAAGDTARRSRRIRLLLVLLPLVVLAAVAYPALRTPLEWRDGGAIVRSVGDADPKATITVPVVFREGGDVSHESGHIFGALAALKGTSTVRLTPSPPSIEVSFDPALVSEQAIKEALAAAGYGGQVQ